MSIPRPVQCLVGVLVVVSIAAAPMDLVAQATGTIAGQAVDANTARPLPGVQITVVGTNLGSLTNQDGRFIIQNVPTGDREVRAVLIGYTPDRRSVALQAGETAVVDFRLRESAIELEGLMVTATGREQRRREVGSSVAAIDVTNVDLAPVQTFSQLLQGRAPGVTVLQSAGTSGTGARVRIRGSNSISLANEPLMIVDGIRVDNSPASQAFAVGGQSVSRLNDFAPEEIASIEILKGPAAAALYGTAAANGVIQITTKRGIAGPSRWTVYTEYGQMDNVIDFPANYRQLGTTASGATVRCFVDFAADGLCTPTELQAWNPLMEAPPFRTGTNRTVGLNVRGGSQQVQYFLSGERHDEDGIYASNSVERISVRGNLDAQVHRTLNVALRTGYTTSDVSLPGNDNNSWGFIGAGLLGSAEDSEFTRGYFSFPNEWRFALERLQSLHRFVGSMDANWQPLSWLSLNAAGGMDLLNRDDESGVAPGIWMPNFNANNAMGNRFVFAGLIRNYTARANAIANRMVTDDLNSITSVGGAFQEDRFQRADGGGFNMLPGTRGLGSLSERFAVNEFDRTTRLVSALFSQQLGWQDRVFMTGAVRGDRSSNFGSQFGFQWYPSVSASWVVAEEPWFPDSDLVSSLRLRTAWGRSGLMPEFRTASQFFDATVATINNASVPAVTVGGAGNADLKPEKSSEWEIGFDLGLFQDRLGVEVGYYAKESTDALVNRRLAPSLGSSATQTVNLGKVTNEGWEAALNARILSLPRVRWDATLGYAANTNELVELGEGIDPIIFGIGADSQRHAEGFPLGHYYGRRIISWGDADGNGLIGEDEIELSDEPTMLGNWMPKREISLSSTLSLFNQVRVFALLEHRGGHQLFNTTEEFRCNTFFNCRGINDGTAPLFEQARAVAAVQGSIDGYIEDADFTKLREVSMTLLGIDRLLNQAGVTGLNDVSVTISGRNLGTWTGYSGLDPEMNSGGQANFSTFEFLGQPPVRSWTVRVNVGF